MLRALLRRIVRDRQPNKDDAVSPTILQDHLQVGYTHHAAQQWSEAVHAYNVALDACDSDNPEDHLALASIYLARGMACRATNRREQMLSDYTTSARWLEETQQHPGFEVYALRGSGRVLSGQLRSGGADYRRFCDRFEPGWDVLLPYDVYDIEQSIEDCNRALAWQSDLYPAVFCRGWWHGLQGNPLGALRDYERGLHLMPEHEAPHIREKFASLLGHASNYLHAQHP